MAPQCRRNTSITDIVSAHNSAPLQFRGPCQEIFPNELCPVVSVDENNIAIAVRNEFRRLGGQRLDNAHSQIRPDDGYRVTSAEELGQRGTALLRGEIRAARATIKRINSDNF